MGQRSTEQRGQRRQETGRWPHHTLCSSGCRRDGPGSGRSEALTPALHPDRRPSPLLSPLGPRPLSHTQDLTQVEVGAPDTEGSILKLSWG